ncbi:MAG TPA: hypothetical protein VLR88_09435 [Propionibacteriaceae bacterium]|nr:hypothetical protein [Propionibacteriaceae bacterium]
MADIFVRVDELAGYAASYAKLAQDSVAAERAVVAGFAEYAGAWGTDAAGAAFLSAYKTPAADTLECVQQVPVQLTSISTAMRATSVAYLGTEATNTDLATGATA